MRWMIPLLVLTNSLFAQCQYMVNVTGDLEQNALHVNATLKDSAKSVSADLESITLPNKQALQKAIKNGANELTFEYTLTDKETINSKFIMQLGAWLPTPSTLCTYDVTVNLPKGMTAISEANSVSSVDKGSHTQWHFIMDKPIDHITLIASHDYVSKSLRVGDVELVTYFFKKHANLADKYLQKTSEFLKHYESKLGPLPYKRFAIVENRFQTGYSMPTFTLIGDRLITKPYLINRSLGHELAHQWIGNGIFLKEGSGNWSEGLTTWLSDLSVAKEKSEGTRYRHEALQTYMLETSKEKTLNDFLYRYDKESKTLGYDKGMFLWEMLSNKIGQEKFENLLRQLLASKIFTRMSYEELAYFFMTNAPEIEPDWFSQWVGRKGMASFDVVPQSLRFEKGKFHLPLTILQDSPQRYRMDIPLHVKSDVGEEKRIVRVNDMNATVTLSFENRPFAISVDPERKLFRRLYADEVKPTLATLMHSHDLIVVGKEKPAFLPHGTLVATKDLTTKMLEEKDILFTKDSLEQARKFVGLDIAKGYEWSLRLKPNPWAKGKLVGLVNGKSPRGMKYRLKYYGTYNELGTYKGQMLLKHKPSLSNFTLSFEAPQVSVTPSLEDGMETLLGEVGEKRVVMVGESHTKRAHHANQFRIVKAMYMKDPKLVIALEMFQKPFQKYLDQYIAKEIDLFTMLAKTEYYKRWKYDMYFYADVFEYARENGIKLLAMNQRKEVTRQTTKSGIASLTKPQQDELPKALDFSNNAYRERLDSFFKNAHGKESKMKLDSTRLYQSQIIWDETMADSVVTYLKEHPSMSAVVLVGSGHIRNRDGIPDRIERRLGEKPYVIIQDADPTPDIADRIIMTSPVSGPSSPKLGVYLDYDKMKVSKIIEGKRAYKMGVKKDDIITKFNDTKITGIWDLKLALFKASYLDQPYTLHVKRGDEELTLK